jgi:type IV pilus assembly protein PilY1
MTTTTTRVLVKKAIAQAILAIYGVAHLPFAQATPTQIDSEPLATAAGGSVAPNLMFVLDDSGSMAWQFTPDYVQNSANLCRDSADSSSNLDSCILGNPIFSSASFNFQYYNPSITYLPGYDPSLTAPAATPVYLARSNMPNYNTSTLWAAVKNDSYSSNNPSGTSNVIFGNTDVVYCNKSSPNTAELFNSSICKEPVDHTVTPAAEAAGTGVWRYPNSNSSGSQQNFNFAFRNTRTGTSTNVISPYFYTISQVQFCVNRYGAVSSTSPTNGNAPSKQSYGKGSATDTSWPCNARRFNNGTNNYQYPRFGLIPHDAAAPNLFDTQALNKQEVLTNSAGSATDNANGRWAGMSGFRKWQIVETSAGSNTLPTGYPSLSAAVYANRSDCNFAACNYTQEMTNYANWWAYYRTRIQMMKTAAGLAFFDLDDKFRVGFITINPGSPVSTNKYVPLRVFNASQKSNWYTRFYAQIPSGGTPLREALSRVGRHYAGKTDRINNGMTFDAASLNPQGTADSMIASCQKNFTLLTTDGYWTDATSAYDGVANSGWKIDGTTRMDNQDVGPTTVNPRPFYEGPTASTGTLADVAMYYYKNDLRPPVNVGSPAQDIWEDNVKPVGTDTALWQHMTTYTLGLGLDGVLDYQSDYDSTPPPAGDYADIVSGAKNWTPVTTTGNDESALDDLWHAAVNGRGKFFSARDPNALTASLSEALGNINGASGAGAAAATSNLQPVAGDNWAFTPEYKSEPFQTDRQSLAWHGDVKAKTIDLVGGIVSSFVLWSAQSLLDSKSAASRSIYTFTSDTANFPSKVKAFTWTNGASTTYPTGTNLTTTEQAYFNPAQLSASNGWTSTQTSATTTTAKSLVDFIRGDTTYKDTGNALATDLYRDRLHILGDVVSAQPVYIKAPPFDYTDNGYTSFKSTQAGRIGTLYVAANDGMLHAFETDPDGRPYFQVNGITTITTTDDTFSTAAPTNGTNDGGGERWAYIPQRVLPGLYALAASNYAHRWYVDGTPVVEDYCDTTATGLGSTTVAAYACPGATSWKTVLVGGLNGGGRSYYAIDVTDPLNPKGMWEFSARDPSVTACAATTAAAVGQTSDCDLGLTYGNPIITKLPLGNANSGKWVVIFTSGYDNFKTVDGTAATTAGDGNGYLYILDVMTGRILEKIQTCSGAAGTAGATPTAYSDADPCGFTKINTFHPLSDDRTDNSPVRAYGTTIKGEVWRVDLTQQLSPRAYLVATLKDAGSTVQPITTPPELFLPTGLDTITYSNPWFAPAAIYLGTGRYLGLSDRTTTQRQSIYAIKDIPGTTTTLANARTSLLSRTFTTEFTLNGQNVRNLTAASTANPFTTSNGWYADFPNDASNALTGERVNVDFRIIATTLVIASNVPKVNSCTAGGPSWLNFIDVNTGIAIAGLTTPFTSVKLGSSLVVGISPIQLGDKIKTIVTTADNQQLTFDTPITDIDFQGQRVQWRELTK